MKKILLAIVLCYVSSVSAALVELQNVSQFEDFIRTSKVPVVIQFSAYWCMPCQKLKGVLQKVAPSYNDNQVRIAYIDAFVNVELQTYLLDGYPTIRTFLLGTLASPSFSGLKSESYVRQFINNIVIQTDFDLILDAEPGSYCPVN